MINLLLAWVFTYPGLSESVSGNATLFRLLYFLFDME